jgi:hypothetical protein
MWRALLDYPIELSSFYVGNLMNLSEGQKPKIRPLLTHLAFVIPLNLVITFFFVGFVYTGLYKEPLFYLGLSAIPIWWAITLVFGKLDRLLFIVVWFFGFLLSHYVGLKVMPKLGYADTPSIYSGFYFLFPFAIYACMLFICLIWRLRHPNHP